MRPLRALEDFLQGPWRRPSLAAYAAAVLVLCAALTVIGFHVTNQTNHNTDLFDQGAYLSMSVEMGGSWYPWYTDGTRNPLFPWIAARVLDPADPGFFAAGKKLNVLLAVLGTAALSAFFARRASPLPAFNATALCALAILLPISTFFGAEVVFYVLFLFVCALAARLLDKNPLPLYALLAVLAALCWLAKPSASPFLALFFGFSVVRLALTPFAAKLPWFLQSKAWSPRNFLLGTALFAGLYLALISPRLVHAQRTWGSAFYSLPSFWFWADDWETCVKKYYDCRKVRLAELPPAEQPTLAGYFRRHTMADAGARLQKGAAVRLGQFFYPEEKWRFPYEKRERPKRVVLPYRGFYVIGLGLLAAAMGVFALVRGTPKETGPVALPCLLALATFALYVLATGWYLPTGPGHRFILALYLPAVWILTQGAESLRRASRSISANFLSLAVHAFIGTLLVWRLVVLVSCPPFEKILHAF